MKILSSFKIFFLMVVTLFIFTACSNSPAPNKPIPQDSSSSKIIQVKITNFSFDPQTLTIHKGDTVMWTNMDSAPHTVTGKDFKSATLNKNDTFKFTFNDTGNFDYVCSFHSEMTGNIIVK
ncbi:cupredoxin domain-containing protein [Clostridium pasteurianum]|uniref:Plastocyanin n=1 Tax=Clostridium pasteurianum BC1 TaxID=86416 RepID=R4K3K7_CLOPA|nr:cupredoxin family copper-binding protein [Clostridium pasteurianum]AGK97163.1 plastocyanin [Clostridium pasteurianum BC1]